MDLTLTEAQERLASDARSRFEAGQRPPIVDGSLTDLVVVARELGRAARPSTFHTEVLARLLGWQGPGLAAVALDVADGVARFVAHGAEADTLLVRSGAGHVVEIDLRGTGPVVRPIATIGDDGRCDVTLGSAATLAVLDCDIEGAVARAAIVLSADAVGAAGAALDAAVAHVITRHQWGAPLATLQAVQHRCANMLLDVTMASDAVFDAAGVADRGADEDQVRLAAAYANATAIERCRRATASAHQLAGGHGIDADAPFHRWYRRVKAAEPVLGDARQHRDAIAAALLDDQAAPSI